MCIRDRYSGTAGMLLIPSTIWCRVWLIFSGLILGRSLTSILSLPSIILDVYKRQATAFNGLKKGTILGKGAINNRVTNHLMKLLEKQGVPTHFVEELNDRETCLLYTSRCV